VGRFLSKKIKKQDAGSAFDEYSKVYKYLFIIRLNLNYFNKNKKIGGR
jgi:hypothetical protein